MYSKSSKRVAASKDRYPFTTPFPIAEAFAPWARFMLDGAFFPLRMSTTMMSAALGAMLPTVDAPRPSGRALSGNVIHVDFQR